MKQAKYPAGWDEDRVRRVLEHYETQSDEEADAPFLHRSSTKGAVAEALHDRSPRRRAFTHLGGFGS